MEKRSPQLWLVAGLVLSSINLTAQSAKQPLPGTALSGGGQHSIVQSTPLSGVVSAKTSTERWANKLVRLEARNPGLPEVNVIKDAKLAEKWSTAARPLPPASPKAVLPVVGTNMEGNWSVQQTPPDNSMAISNGGWIVSVNNDEIVYAQSSGTLTYAAFWADFFQGQGLFANIYDPKVLYDSQADRFFMTVLHGSEASNSILLLCFSQTNNPTDGWNIYQLSGNPLNNNCWFDYPSIGVSNNEVYLTGNLFTSGNNQFNQVVIFQVTKSTGYNGSNLNWQYWYNLSADITPFTIVPASWGQSGNYGPGILFMSSASGGDNRYIAWELTNDLGSNPSLNAYTVNVPSYSPAADAQQPNNPDLLDNGDCRILGAFYLNQTLHCIHHGDVGSGWNGLIYTRINVTNLQATQSEFGAPGVVDISYPQFTSFSGGTSDPSVMVAYLQSSTQIYPEVRVVNCDANMNWGPSALVKAGETHVDFLQGEERWGDYTGMARRHNASNPEVWLAACYGANVTGQLNNTYKTWIAEITGSSSSVEEEEEDARTVLYPVPAIDLFTLELNITERAQHTMQLIDAEGAVVKVLYQGFPAMGRNQLSFNRGQLAPGTYSLVVSTPQKRIAHETLVVQ
ncbi:MAG: hypothetical protein IPJ76_00660 [Flavobacteriales bacterium]|nr:MAG: hypothetical protein IPJ76_00660 [Flavobacteriales bacterium]